ncbi:hypothetical protein BBEV_0840 [Salisediminibacterium beveridgei]|uniref:SHOCT domain-containing protein n=1 Tax=Salisediminibacterium beveridgei TaxID=632773 RepID=A0A1D7QT77_9BACI|nr:hypothetical protein BBEV_0840 [Salisediminibacterium beveridgei]
MITLPFLFDAAKKENIKNIEFIDKQKDALASKGFTKFNPSYNYNKTIGIALSDDKNSVGIINKLAVKKINYKKILKVDIVEDGTTVTSVSRVGQIGSALVGGMLAGGAGAVIGGLSSEKTQNNKVRILELQILVNDELSPIKKVKFFESDNYVYKDDQNYKFMYEKAEKWKGILEVMINKADKEEQKTNSEYFGQSDKNEIESITSVADELRKLNDLTKEGIISKEQFEKEKEKLLSK